MPAFAATRSTRCPRAERGMRSKSVMACSWDANASSTAAALAGQRLGRVPDSADILFPELLRGGKYSRNRETYSRPRRHRVAGPGQDPRRKPVEKIEPRLVRHRISLPAQPTPASAKRKRRNAPSPAIRKSLDNIFCRRITHGSIGPA